MGFIYLLYNDDGYGYIGQTKNIKNRLIRHNSPSEKKYGVCKSKLLGDFKCEILEECGNEYLADYEQYWYDLYNNLFPNMLVNRKRPRQTPTEYYKKYKKPQLKEYYEKNKERLNKYNRERYRLKKNLL